MGTDEIVGLCAVCGKEVTKGKATAIKRDGLWICGLGCGGKYNKEKKKWDPEKWNELQQRQALYDQRQLTERESPPLIEPIEGKAKELLDETLRPGETLHVFVKSGSGYLAATDTRMIVINTKSSVLGGSICNGFPYEHITGIQFSKGILLGKILILTSGSKDRLPFFGGVHAAENAVEFYNDDYEKFRLAKQKIDELMAERKLNC